MTPLTSDRSAAVVAAAGLPDIVGAYVDGSWVTPAGCDLIEVEDPATTVTVAVCVDASDDLVDAAVDSAHRCFREQWGPTAPTHRSAILYAIAQALRRDVGLLAQLESVDTGKPLSQARGDVETSARYFEYYAGLADKFSGRTLPQPAATFAYTVREPYGVVAHITPWNSPLAQLSRGVAPSLAAGNTVVIKPSELAPLSSLLAAEIFRRAGLPAGACNVIPGSGTAGQTLVEHRLVRHVSFTGSVATGQKVQPRARWQVTDDHPPRRQPRSCRARGSGRGCSQLGTELLRHHSAPDPPVGLRAGDREHQPPHALAGHRPWPRRS
jgi:aldehyde dehydrogenase (NAD+)